MEVWIFVVLLCGSGGAQTISSHTECFQDSDVVFLVDGSGSVSHSDFLQVKTFIGSMMSRFSLGPSKTRVGLVQFSTRVFPSIPLDQGFDQLLLKRTLSKMTQQGGGTNTGAALQFVVTEYFLKSSRSKVLVLITDGESQDKVEPASQELRRLRVQTFVIGFGSGNIGDLFSIGTSPQHCYFVPSADDLPALLQPLCSTGLRCQTLEKADVVLLVDGSYSVGERSFQMVKKFVAQTISAFDVGPDRVQIGLAQYSGDPRTEWHLNSHPNDTSLLQAVAKLQLQGGDTMTGKALAHVLQNDFCEEAGLRDGVRKMAVLITDGKSQDDVVVSAQNLRDSGVELYAIGVQDADVDELRLVASDPDETHVFHVSDFHFLFDIVDVVTKKLCHSINATGPPRPTGLSPALPSIWVSQFSPPGPLRSSGASPPGPLRSSGASPGDGGPVFVQRGLDFTVSCFVKPHFLDGYFLLVTPFGNHTLPVGNHSAHFLFSSFSPAHSGAYTCVYLLQVRCGNITFISPALRLKVGDPDSKLLIKAAVIFPLLLIFNIALHLYYRPKGAAPGTDQEQTRTEPGPDQD